MSDKEKKPFRLGDILSRLKKDGSLDDVSEGATDNDEHRAETGHSGLFSSPGSMSALHNSPKDDSLPAQPVFGTPRARNEAQSVPRQEKNEPPSSFASSDDNNTSGNERASSGTVPPSPPPPPGGSGSDGGNYFQGGASFSENDDEEEFDIYRYLSVILRRKWLIAACAIIAGLYSLYNFSTAEKHYIARARLLFTPGYRQLINDDAMMWQLWGSREIRLNTHLELLKSNRQVLESVSDKLGENVSPTTIKAGITVHRGGGKDDDSENNIIVLTLQHNHPDTAQLILNTLCREYMRYISEVNARDLTSTIIKLQTQINKIKNDLSDKENKLRAFKENNELVELNSATNTIISKLSNMESNLQNTRIDLKSNRDKIKSVTQEMTQNDMKVVGNITYEDPYRNRLSELEFDLNNLLTEYSPDHYKVRMVKDKIEKMKEIIRSDIETKIARKKTYVNNPIQQTLRQQYIDLNLAITALESKRKAQEQIVEQLNRKLQSLPALQQEYARLQRNTSSLEKTLRKLQDKYETLKIKRDSQESDLKILELAKVPQTAYSDMSVSRIPLGIIIGLIIGIALAFVWEYLDQTIKDPQEVEKSTGLPLLGLIPYYENDESPILHGDLTKDKTKLEPYRALRTSLKHIFSTHHIQSLLVCSAVKGEGKTTIAINLAISFALDGRKVIIVDGDLRRPSLHGFFHIPSPSKGLTHCLQGSATIQDVITPTNIPNLYCVTAGERVADSAELLGSAHLSTLISSLKEHSQLVIFDSPALVPISDSITIAASMDATIYVLRALWTPRKATLQSRNQLSQVGSNIIGAVLNGLSPASGYYPYYYGYYRYYSYKYAYEEDEPAPRHSIRRFGLGLEKKAREGLHMLKLSLPSFFSRMGTFFSHLGRSTLFWILLVLFVGLAVASGLISSRRAHKQKTIKAADISYRGSVAQSAESVSGSSARSNTPHTPITIEKEQTSSYGVSSSDIEALHRAVQQRDSAFFSGDFSEYRRYYDRDEFSFPGGGYTEWQAKMRHFFNSRLPAYTIPQPDSNRISPASSQRYISRTTLVVTGPDNDTTRADFISLWHTTPAGWKIIKEKRRFDR